MKRKYPSSFEILMGRVTHLEAQVVQLEMREEEGEDVNITIEEVRDLCKVLSAVKELLLESDKKVRSLIAPLVEVWEKPSIIISANPQTAFERIRRQLFLVEREAISLHMNTEKLSGENECVSLELEESAPDTSIENIWKEITPLSQKVEALSIRVDRQGEFLCKHFPFAQGWID